MRLHPAGWLLALAVLLMGLIRLGDFAPTWDEPESYRAGTANVELTLAVLRGEQAAWPWHELPGYQFLFDTVRSLAAGAISRLIGGADPIAGFHAVNLVFSTLSLLLVGILATRVTADRGVGLASMVCLLLSPKFLGHAVNNPKDSIGLLVTVLGVFAIEAAVRSGQRPAFLAAGAVVGFAGASFVGAAALAPLAVVWSLAASGRPWRQRVQNLALLAASAALFVFLCWPWLWPDPVTRAIQIVQHIRRLEVDMRVLYLGSVHESQDLPWHYSSVSLLLATPLALLLAAAASLTWPRAVPGRRLAGLAGLWIAVYLAAEIAGGTHYDGARHLLPVLPAVACLAGLGLVATWRRLSRPGHGPRLGRLAVGAALLATAGSVLAVHPYYDAYLSEPVRLAVRGDRSTFAELEYWGATYGEAARWLEREAAPRSTVVIPMAPWLLRDRLRQDLALSEDTRYGRPSQTVRYVVLMTRPAWWRAKEHRLRGNHRPVHRIQRSGSTLLEIYRLEPVRRPLGSADRSQPGTIATRTLE